MSRLPCMPSVDRRTFFGLASLSGAVAAHLSLTAQGQEASAPPAEKMIKKAVKIGMVQIDGPLVVKFKVLKELGYDGVELDSPNGYDPAEVLKARDESGLTIHGVVDSTHWRDTLSHPEESVRQKGLNDLLTALQDSKTYGGTSVLLVPGVVNKEATYDEAWERSQAQIKKALPKAEELGIQILLENVWNNFLTTPQETARFIDELGSPWVGSYFDIGNAVRYSPPHTWIPVLGSRIKKLDIKEFSLSLYKEGLFKGFDAPLTEGDCQWPLVMTALKQINYQGWGTAEVAGGDKNYLADLASRMDKAFAS